MANGSRKSRQTWRTRNPLVPVLLLALVSVAAAVLASSRDLRSLTAISPGAPRLVSMQPLPETDGAMCEWQEASAQGSLMAALQQRQQGQTPATGSRGTVD